MEADEVVEEQLSQTASSKPSSAPSLLSVESQKQADAKPPPLSPDMVYPGPAAATPTPNIKTGIERNISEVGTEDAASTKASNSSGTRKKSSKDGDGAGEADDTVSLLSTSSKSLRFSGSGSGFGGSWRGKILPSSSGPTVDSGKKGSGMGSTSRSTRSRRTSNATISEDEAAGLGTEVNLAIQDASKEGGSWGFGDEVRMGLE